MTVSRIAAAILIGLFVSCGAAASPQPQVTIHTTPNGVQFWHVQLPAETHQVVSFAWRDGTSLAAPAQARVATLAADLLAQGPMDLDASSYFEQLQDLQGKLSFSATGSLFKGKLVVPAEDLKQAAQLVGRNLAQPSLPIKKFLQSKKARGERRQEDLEQPQVLATHLFVRSTLAHNPHVGYLSDDPERYRAVTIDQIVTWHQGVLARDNVVVATAGPLSADAMSVHIDEMFLRLPQGARVPSVRKPVSRGAAKVIVIERDVSQTALVAGELTHITVTPDFARAKLARYLIQGDLGSETGLTSVIRERLGASYDVDVSLDEADGDTTMLVISTLVSNESAPAVVAALKGEYARFFQDSVSADDLEAFKRAEISTTAELFQDADSLADRLLSHARYKFPVEYLRTFERRIANYKPHDIASEIAKVFPRNLRIIVVAPSAEGFKADCVIKQPEEIERCQ